MFFLSDYYFDISFFFITHTEFKKYFIWEHTEFKKYFIWEHLPYIQLRVEEIILQVSWAFLWYGICSGDWEGEYEIELHLSFSAIAY